MVVVYALIRDLTPAVPLAMVPFPHCQVPDKSEWEAMAQLNKAIGTRFIIGEP
jgi:hypothetical protein